MEGGDSTLKKIFIIILLILNSQLACCSNNKPGEDFEKARSIDDFQKIINLFPKSKWACQSTENIALIYYSEQNYKKAIEVFYQLLRYPSKYRSSSFQNEEDILSRIGGCYERLYQFSKAYNIYKNIIKKYGCEKGRQDAYRIEFIDKNRLVELEEAKAKGKIKDSEYYLVLGKALLSEKELSGARLMLEKANSLEPNNPEILLRLGVTYNSIGDDFLHMLYFDEDKAEIERAQAIKRKGFVIFNRIINEYPQSELASEAQFMLGIYYGDNIAVWDNDYEKAISEYQKVLRNYPNSLEAPAAQYDIADCYIFSKNYEIAIDEYKKVIKNYPKSKEAASSQNAIGDCCFGLKDYFKAIEEYQKTIENYPKSKVVEMTLIGIARVYEEGLHNYQKAIETYKRYLKAYPHGEFERVVLDELKRLKKEKR